MATIHKSKDFPDSFFRVSVKGLFVKEGKILLLTEPEHLKSKWELPGGGLGFGEDIQDGLKREIEEETGLKVTRVSENPVYVWTWRFENRRNMDWYYSLVLAYRIDLENLDFKVTKECQQIAFFSKEELGNIELHMQTNGLKTVFDPEDFTSKEF